MWIGGASYSAEQRAAREATPQLLIATPGRLQQHMEDERVRWGGMLEQLRLVVVHDADAFLDPGGNLRCGGCGLTVWGNLGL